MKIEKEIVAGCGCAGIAATRGFKKMLDRRIKEIAAQERAERTLPASCAHDKHQKRIDLDKKR